MGKFWGTSRAVFPNLGFLGSLDFKKVVKHWSRIKIGKKQTDPGVDFKNPFMLYAML